MARRAVVYVQLDGHGGDVDGNAAERKAYRGKEGSSSFLKKEPKNFCLFGLRAYFDGYVPHRVKVFWFFFSKKNCFLPLLRINFHAKAG
jgi:hypothetical protein